MSSRSCPIRFFILIGFVVALASTFAVPASAQTPTAVPSECETLIFPSHPSSNNPAVVILYGDPATAEGSFQLDRNDPNSAMDPQGWTSVDLSTSTPQVGDYAKLVRDFTDPDAIAGHDNPSWQWSFLDDGSSPNNLPGFTSGGSVDANWTYGIPGGWVTPYAGGPAGPGAQLHNEIRSPFIDWDLPGTADDSMSRAILEFDTWSHLLLENAIFRYWRIRTEDSNGWGPWRDHGFVYYSEEPSYEHVAIDITDLIPISDVQRIQIALGVIQLNLELGISLKSGLQSPLYDNVKLWKYEKVEPFVWADEADLYQDAFSRDGSQMGSPVPLDAARDLTAGAGTITPQDDLVIHARGGTAGNPMSQTILHARLRANPIYAADRATELGNLLATNLGTDCKGWTIYEFQLVGTWISADTYSFSLPDAGLFYPGDQIQYYVEAVPVAGSSSTLPEDISNWGNFLTCDPSLPPYDPRFTVDALPTYDNINNIRPGILIWVDSKTRPGFDELVRGMYYLNQIRGVDYDVYRTGAPCRRMGNGLGSPGAWGAVPAQLDSYEGIIYLGEHATADLLSDGSGGPYASKSDDIGLLTDWHQNLSPFVDRRIAYFADNLASYLNTGTTAQQSYLSSTMGLTLVDENAFLPLSNNVLPISGVPGFFVKLDATKTRMYTFDSIGPGPGALMTHQWDPPSPSGGFPAGKNDRIWSDHNSTDYLCTISYSSINNITFKAGSTGGLSARDAYLSEILDSFGLGKTGVPTGVSDPPSTRLRVELSQAIPNPFNPRTSVHLKLSTAGYIRAGIYDLRGRQVRLLHEGRLDSGSHTLLWRGQDDRGRNVASGAYFLQVESTDGVLTRKMALVR